MNTEWVPRIQNELARVEAAPPTETEDIVYLAALYALQKRFACEGMPMPESSEIVSEGQTAPSFNRFIAYVTDELRDADKYIQAGEKDIAKDELKHAAYFLEKSRSMAYSKSEQRMVRDLGAQHDLMTQKIGEK